MTKSSPICFLFPLSPTALHRGHGQRDPGPQSPQGRSTRRKEGKASLWHVAWFPTVDFGPIPLNAYYSLIVINHQLQGVSGTADRGEEDRRGIPRAETDEKEQTWRRKKNKGLKEEKSEWRRKKRLFVKNKTHTISNSPCNSLKKNFWSLRWNNWRALSLPHLCSSCWTSSPGKHGEVLQRG